MLVVDSRSMGGSDREDRPRNDENRGERFRDQDQPDVLSEYEFFLPEIDSPGEHLLKQTFSDIEKMEHGSEDEMIDFFLPD